MDNVKVNEQIAAQKLADEAAKKDGNAVLLIGKVISIFPKAQTNIVTVRIATRGKSSAYHVSFPKVYCFKDDNLSVDDILVGDSVRIHGHLVNNRKRRPNGSVFYSQAVVADKIEKNDSLFKSELGVEGFDSVVAQPLSLVYLKGCAEKIERVGKNAVMIRLNAPQKNHNNHVNVITYQEDAFFVNPGDEIEVYGRLETRRKEMENGPKKYYQNVIVQKINNLSRPVTALS